MLMTHQKKLFPTEDPGEVFGVAYGCGVDSTAMLIGLQARGIRPDFILFADVGSEKQGTYAFLPVMQTWLAAHDFPPVTVVRYVPRKAPYTTIEGNMTMNATLPGTTFGRASCTIKWKIVPQDKWTSRNTLCQSAWEHGRQVKKAIGFDAGENYRKTRKAHSSSDQYEYLYPLIEWGWEREECKARIQEAGLPVPPKSACIFCPNQKPDEIADLTPEERGRIVRMEVVAEPYNRKVHGLWRRPRKRDLRPGSITEYMVRNKIEFVHPDDLPDRMPLNPKCGKFERGYTFRPPHDAPSLSAMLENEAHWNVIENI